MPRRIRKGKTLKVVEEDSSSAGGDEQESGDETSRPKNSKSYKKGNGSTSKPVHRETDSDATYDSEDKYLPEKWILTREVLIREHNRPRISLITPTEDEDDPRPIPIRLLDIMRRATTFAPTKAESIIEDYWVDPKVARRDVSEEWLGRGIFPYSSRRRRRDMSGRAEDWQKERQRAPDHRIHGRKCGPHTLKK